MQFDYYLDSVVEPVNLEAVQDFRGKLPIGDFPYTGMAFPKYLSTRVFDRLGMELLSVGCIKKATIDNDNYYLFWPAAIDCLDDKQSEVTEMASGYRRLIKPVFKERLLKGAKAFIVPEFQRQHVFVTEEFKQLMYDPKLTGLEISLV